MKVEIVREKVGGLTVLVVRGFFFLLPFLVTVWLVRFLANTADSFVGATVRAFLSTLLSETAMKSDFISFLAPFLSLIVAIGITALFGVIASFHLGKRGLTLIDGLFLLIPGVNRIFRMVKQLRQMFGEQEDGTQKFSRTVWFTCDGYPEIGFVTNEKVVDGAKILTLFTPVQAPNPIGGRVFHEVPEEETRPSGMSIEESIQYVVTLGAAQPKESEDGAQ